MVGTCDRSSGRGTPPSPVPTPGSISSMGKSTPMSGVVFPTDSTTSERERESRGSASIHAMYKPSHSNIHRQADDMDPGGKLRTRYRDLRDEDHIQMRDASPGDGGLPVNNVFILCFMFHIFCFFPDSRFTIDSSPGSPSMSSLDTFRTIAQPRDRFLPPAIHPGEIDDATIAAQGGLSGSASDYMRLATTVRDPENGNTISGSGKETQIKHFGK